LELSFGVDTVCALAVSSTLLSSSSSSSEDDDDVADGFEILARFTGFALSRDAVSLAVGADVAFRFFVADSLPLLDLTPSLSLDDDDSASLKDTFSELKILPGILEERSKHSARKWVPSASSMNTTRRGQVREEQEDQEVDVSPCDLFAMFVARFWSSFTKF